MKSLRIFAWVFLVISAVSCAKEQDMPVEERPLITISASLSEDLTKVSFTPSVDGSSRPMLELAWAEGDQIRIYNHADHSQYEDFTLHAGSIGQKTGTFSGTALTAASYDIEVLNPAALTATHLQPSEGNAGNLKYMASVEDVASYASIEFTDISSVLLLRAKLPSTEVAAAIASVDLVADAPIFFDDGVNEGKTLTIAFVTKGDAGEDAILDFYATLPVGSKAIPAGTKLLMHFNAPETAHTVYTRYAEIPASTLMAGKLNALTVNAVHADQWAGFSDDGTAGAPYLIADRYQMEAMHDLLVADAKKYFKLVADVDMEGAAWSPLNSVGTQYVNLDGNGHTLSNFSISGTTDPTGLFSKLNGQVCNLTIDGASATSTTGALGILAGNLGEGGSEDVLVDHVTLRNCHVGDAGAYLRVSGILAGNVKRAGTIVRNVTVSDSDNTSPKSVSGSNMYIGGLLGYVQVAATVLSCSVNDCTVTGKDIVGGLIGGLGNNNAASCINCFVGGATVIDAGSRRVGGLVGMLNGATVSRCGVESGVTITSASYDVAGLVGIASNAFSLENSYSRANVTGKDQVGGLIGRLYGAGTVSKCFAAGTLAMTNGTKLGGLVGSIEAAGTVSKCISWNADLSLYGANSGGGTVEDSNYVKDPSDAGTVSSHAQEAARDWSGEIWDFGAGFPTLKDSGLPGGDEPANAFNLIPYPQSLTPGEGSFALYGAAVYYDSGFGGTGSDVVDQLSARLGVVTGSTSGEGEADGINFLQDGSLGDEAYTLTVSSGKVVVKAATRAGLFYAVQTLKQLMPVAVYGASAVTAEWTIPAVEIEDAPRFVHRGFALDVARHFYTVAEVKKYIDLMAQYKMNRLHWMLTNDQGWRFPVPSYPNLVTVGSTRSSTPVYAGEQRTDGGYYTREQLEDVVQYAADRNVTVIPEFDIPGHTLAALASYPDLGCTGSGYSVLTGAGTSPDVLCLGKDHDFSFVKTVLDEICDIFPSEYIHIGGDEVPSTVEWKTCSDCLDFMSTLGLSDISASEMTDLNAIDNTLTKNAIAKEKRFQYHFTKAIRTYLAAKGRKVITWQEGLNDEYDLYNDAFDFGGGAIESWTSASRGIFAAKHNVDVIMAPSYACYFSIMQTATPGEPGNGPRNGGDTSNGNNSSDPSKWRPVTLSAAYDFNPHNSIPAEKQVYVKGVECAIWTEFIDTVDQLEYMLLPRLMATSEVGWTPQASKDFSRFTHALDDKHFEILDTEGYNYRHVYE